MHMIKPAWERKIQGRRDSSFLAHWELSRRVEAASEAGRVQQHLTGRDEQGWLLSSGIEGIGGVWLWGALCSRPDLLLLPLTPGSSLGGGSGSTPLHSQLLLTNVSLVSIWLAYYPQWISLCSSVFTAWLSAHCTTLSRSSCTGAYTCTFTHEHTCTCTCTHIRAYMRTHLSLGIHHLDSPPSFLCSSWQGSLSPLHGLLPCHVLSITCAVTQQTCSEQLLCNEGW